MLLSDLLQIVNSSNFLVIHEMTEDGNDYDMIYTGQIDTRSEYNKVIEKYGKRKVKEIDTSAGELYIELERYI